MSAPDPSSAQFFEALYRSAADADPWGFASAPYEQNRYRAILDSLAGRRFRHGFEPGCSIGVLTRQLATICERVDACDVAPTAVAAARKRCAACKGVTIERAALTGAEPWEQYDLVVLCEIGYYFSAAAWRALIDRMVAGLRPGALLLSSHWQGHSSDHVQHGDAVQEALQPPLLLPTFTEQHEGFRLQQWIRRST